MTVDDFLSQYRTLVDRIGRRTSRLTRLRNEVENIAAVWGEHRSTHSQDAPYVRILEEIDTLVREQKEDAEILPYLQAQVLLMISSIPEEELQYVMEQRYLEGRSYRQIAKDMFIGVATVNRRLFKALTMLTMPDQPVLIPGKI